MRLLVDMDGVIAHWGAEYDRALDRIGLHTANIPRSADQDNWDLNVGRTSAEQNIIRQVMEEEGFYRRLEPIEGAKEALNNAVAAGHDVRIVSTPYVSNPTCASDKIDWIVRHYGSEWASRLVLTADKTIVHGDLLVDDKPSVTGSMEPTWRHIVFGDYAYNRKALATIRLSHWSERTIPDLEKIL